MARAALTTPSRRCGSRRARNDRSVRRLPAPPTRPSRPPAFRAFAAVFVNPCHVSSKVTRQQIVRLVDDERVALQLQCVRERVSPE